MQELELIFEERNQQINALEEHLKLVRSLSHTIRRTQQLQYQIMQVCQTMVNDQDQNKGELQQKKSTLNQWQQREQKLKKDLQNLPKKQQYLQKQKLRSQRENWILKVLKSVKNLNDINLEIFYQTINRMIIYYHKNLPKNIEVTPKQKKQAEPISQKIVNTFIQFYNLYRPSEIPQIKKVIRPNNKFVIFDLLKLFVETHRHYFKTKVQQSFIQIRRKVEPEIKRQENQQKQKSVQIFQTKQQEKFSNTLPNVQISEKISVQMKIFLKQYHLNAINNLNTAQLKQRANEIYHTLLEINQKRNVNYSISQYYQKCWSFAFKGEKQQAYRENRNKNYGYNLSKLYTKEQIKKMQINLQIRIRQNQKMIKQFEDRFNQNSNKVFGDKSATLRQYMKVYLEKQTQSFKLKQINQQTSKYKDKIHQVNQWLPLTIIKDANQFHLLQIYVINNDTLTPLSEFEAKYGISIKSYLQSCRRAYDRRDQKQIKILELEPTSAKSKKQTKSSHNKIVVHSEINTKTFKKNKFFSLNMSKIKQLISEDVMSRLFTENKKKQSIFPSLRSNELKQQQFADSIKKTNRNSLNDSKTKSLSQQKLVPLFKNQFVKGKIDEKNRNLSNHKIRSSHIIPNKTQQHNNDKLQSQKTQHQVDQLYVFKNTLSYQKVKKNGKLDSIIESIIKQRNLKVH